MSVEVKEVIVCQMTRRGQGIEGDPTRVITEVFEKDGTWIAERDPIAPDLHTNKDVLDFAKWLKKMGQDPDQVDSKIVKKWMNGEQP